LNRDPMTSQSFKRRQELIELVEAEAYAVQLSVATGKLSQ